MHEQDDHLEEEIREMLKLLLPVPARTLENAHRGREEFIASVASLQPDSPQVNNRHFLSFAVFRSRFSVATAALLIVLMLLASGGAVVASAQGSLPGEALYPFKQWTETTHLALTTSPSERVALLINFSQRRFDEMDTLLEKGEAVPESLAQDTQANLDQLMVETDVMTGTEKTQAIANIEQLLVKLASRSPQGAPAVPVVAQVNAMIAEHLALVLLGKTDPAAFHEAMQNRPTGLPPTPPGQFALPPGQATGNPGNPLGTPQEPPTKTPGNEDTPPEESETPDTEDSEETDEPDIDGSESPGGPEKTPKESQGQGTPGSPPETPSGKPTAQPTNTQKPTATDRPTFTPKALPTDKPTATDKDGGGKGSGGGKP